MSLSRPAPSLFVVVFSDCEVCWWRGKGLVWDVPLGPYLWIDQSSFLAKPERCSLTPTGESTPVTQDS